MKKKAISKQLLEDKYTRKDKSKQRKAPWYHAITKLANYPNNMVLELKVSDPIKPLSPRQSILS